MDWFTRRVLLAGATGSAIGGLAGCTDLVDTFGEDTDDTEGTADPNETNGQQSSPSLPGYAAYVPVPEEDRLNFYSLSLDEFYATESVFDLHDPETSAPLADRDTISTDNQNQPVFSFIEIPGLFTVVTLESISTAGLEGLLPDGAADSSFDEWVYLPVGEDEAPADLLFGDIDPVAVGELLADDSAGVPFESVEAPEAFDGYEQADDTGFGTLRVWVRSDLIVIARNERALDVVASVAAGERASLAEVSTPGDRALSYASSYGSVFCGVSPSIGTAGQFGEGITVFASEIAGVESEFATAVAANVGDDHDRVDTLETQFFDRGDLIESGVEDGLYTGRAIYSIEDITGDEAAADNDDDVETALVNAGRFFDDTIPELAPDRAYDRIDFDSVSSDLSVAAVALDSAENDRHDDETEQYQILVGAYQSFVDALRTSTTAIADIDAALQHIDDNAPSEAAGQLVGTADALQGARAASDAGGDAVADLDESVIAASAIDLSAVTDRAAAVGATVDGIESLVEATNTVVEGEQQLGIGFSAVDASEWERAIGAWSSAQSRFTESVAAAETEADTDGLSAPLRDALLERACRSEVLVDGAELLAEAAEDGRDDGFDAYGATAREANQRFKDADGCP